MKFIFALLTCLLPALAFGGTPGFGVQNAVSAGAIDFSRSNPALTIHSSAPELTSITLQSPEILLTDTLVGFTAYHVFAVPGEPPIAYEGHPALPQITRLYRIPNRGGVTLELGAQEFAEIEGIHPLPVENKVTGFARGATPDPLVYQKDAWYPPTVAVVGPPMIFRDFRVVQVTLYPVQVNPATGAARLYHRIDVDLAATDEPGENELLDPRPPSRVFAPLYGSMIANLDEHALDAVTTTPGRYLILCRDQSTALQWADTLATWKRRAGYDVVIDARSSWTAANMRTAITSLYNVSDPPLEFVCILGDPQGGTIGMPTGSTGSSGEYDHFFANVTGDDLEDVAVGRLPASSGADFSTIMAKIMAYERNPYMTDPAWFTRAFLYAGRGYSISSNEILMLWARRQFQNTTGVDNVTVATHDGNVNNTLIAQRLNEGVSYFLWRGTVVGEMTAAAPNGTNNGAKLPVVLTITCGTGDFHNTTSLSESWILAGTASSMKGGVCGIGTATVETHVQYNNTVAGGLVYNICNLDVEFLGAALAGAKAQLYAAFPTDYNASRFVRWNNLMGDPGLMLWTDVPIVTNVTYPATVNVGTRRIRPQVMHGATGEPIRDALVVLWKGSETYARALTDEFGYADVPVTVNTPGTMTLTVTKRNHKPFLANIACVNTPQMVTVSSIMIDDDNVGGTSGNGDGRINPGELIDLPVYVRNFGQSQAGTSVMAQLSSTSPQLTVITGAAAFPNVSPGDSVLSTTPFRVSIAPTAKHNTSLDLTFAVTAGGQLTHSSLRLTCQAGEAVYLSHQVSGGDGDGFLEPGETANLQLTLQNTGVLGLTGVTGELRSKSSYVSVGSSVSAFGTIAPGGTAYNAVSYVLHCNPLAYPGYPARLLLVLSAPGGYADSLTFVLPLGIAASSDPTGPDAYGYFAYDNTDTGYEQSVPFSYVPINSIGTNLNLNDVGEQPPTAPTYSVLRTLPFEFTFYGQAYNQLTVCSNGWAAFGDQADQDHFRNYSIPGQQAPDAMIAPLWDDLKTVGTGLGVWEYYDAQNHRYIVQWRAQGAFQNNQQDFEIILLDPAHYPTRDGNGIVIVQYQSVTDMYGQSNDVHYATVGIQAPGCTVGLQYRFNNSPAPGAASLTANRNIVFTTEHRTAFGHIIGRVTDAATQQAMPGVAITLDGESYQTVTDTAGRYALENILIGTYTVRARRAGFNEQAAIDVVVEINVTDTVDFALLHPELALSTEQIAVSLPADPQQAYFEIINDGNGPLDYEINVQFASTGGLDDSWELLAELDVTAATNDQLIQGCEFMGDYWYASGALAPGGENHVYRFDRAGHFAGSFRQPTTTDFGWMDIAGDGQYLYGSEEATSGLITGVDLSGAIRTTIPAPVNPARAIAYNPQLDHFWVADYLTDIYEIDRQGTIIRTLTAPLPVTGLAWHPTDPLGYNLYVFGPDAQSQRARVTRMHPVSGAAELVINLDRLPGDRAGGCSITPGWNSTLLVFGGILQGATGDRLGIWELDFNTTWIAVTPMRGSIAAGTAREIELAFDPVSLRDDIYRVNLNIANNSALGTRVLPVTLTVSLPAGTPELAPTAFALHQNYPNPFNAQTSIRYDLRQAGPVSLRLYNLLGQHVASVVDEVQAAGSHSVNLRLDGLASGIYLYRLESGEFTATRKLMLLR